MVMIRFDVNDSRLRDEFLNDSFPNALLGLGEHTAPLWGSMTAQHMVEHLMWTFQCSTGKITLSCHTPEHLLDRVKTFLYDNRVTPKYFKNPVLTDQLEPYRFPSFAVALEAVRAELNCFLEAYRLDPAAIHTHPLFGPIQGDQWHRAHFKHAYHHMLQFNLIAMPSL